MKIKLLLAAGALLAGTSAWAQTGPAEQAASADDLVCQLSGDCEGVAGLDATKDMPESRGFAIKRRTASADTTPPPAAIGQRSRTRIVAEPVRPAAAAAQPGRNRLIAKPAPASIGRANLRVSFVSGSANLTSVGQSSANAFVTALASPSLAGKKFRIEGHTDSMGTRESNLDLSQRRAQAVVDYLVAHGADRSRFEVAGYGFDKPIAGRVASDGVNRRVEVVLVK